MKYDVAVIGAGPAGLSAAINLKILNKNVKIFSSEEVSSKLAKAPMILNYLGVQEVTGKNLASAFLKHATDMGIKIECAKVHAVYDMGASGFMLDFGNRTEEATAVILCTGTSSTATIKNEDIFLGKGVSYCATCDAPLYKGRTACVIGYDQESIEEANYIAELCKKVIYIPMVNTEKQLRADIEVLKMLPQSFEGTNRAEKLVCKQGEIVADIYFVIKSLSAEKLIVGLQTAEGAVLTDKKMATNIKGVFAAGDATGKPYKFQKSAGEGQIAAFSAAEYLQEISNNT